MFLLSVASARYVHLETEGFAVGIQELVIKTRNYKKHCLGVEVIDRNRRPCDKVGETMK
jgi:hypothetical protein